MEKIVVLGATGLVGSMVFSYLKRGKRYLVHGTTATHNSLHENISYFSVDDFLVSQNYPFLKSADYIINCIGYKDINKNNVKTAISVNSLFPHLLASNFPKTKIISITTDGVFSGKKGKYIEDDIHDAQDYYGRTKSLGEGVYQKLLHLRCSLIGPDPYHKKGLLEWFLNQEHEVLGFKNYIWQGVTTLQFAELIRMIIENDYFDKVRSENHVLHFLPNEPISKYSLLLIMNEIFNKNIDIKESLLPEKIDRSLSTKYEVLNSIYPKRNIKGALVQLKDYMMNI